MISAPSSNWPFRMPLPAGPVNTLPACTPAHRNLHLRGFQYRSRRPQRVQTPRAGRPGGFPPDAQSGHRRRTAPRRTWQEKCKRNHEHGSNSMAWHSAWHGDTRLPFCQISVHVEISFKAGGRQNCPGQGYSGGARDRRRLDGPGDQPATSSYCVASRSKFE